MHGRLLILAFGLSLTSLLQAASPVVVMPGDTLATKGGFPWNLPETNINLKIATAATPAAKYTNAVGTGAGMLGLSYTDFAQYGQVTITGTIPANALNLDNSSYLEIGLITQAMVAQSEAWYLSGMFNDSVFMLISTTSSGQYSACAGDYNLGGGRWSSKINFDKTAALSYRLVLDFTTSQASLTVDNGSGYSTPVTVTFGIADWTAGGSTIPGLTPEDYSQAAVIAQLYNEGDSAVNSATFGDVTVYGGLLDELSLNPTAESLYVKTGESVIIDMDVANLQQMVNGCQALLGYSSTYFPAAGTVAAGGGVWSELIYESWNTGAGELDTAIGVTLEGGPAGTQDDGTVAVITLTAGPTEGTTRMVFRPDGANGYATMLSDLNAAPVWPNKIDSVNIIIDNTPPVITCPIDVTVSTDAGTCGAVVSLDTPTVTDALAGVESVTNDAPATFPTGETIVTWTATDKAGNSASCTQKVTVNDTELPTITCPAAASADTDAGQCYATGVALGTPTTADNCGVASVTNDAPAQFPKGVTTVTWTVADTSGNTATCAQTVTVTDVEAPTVTIDSVIQGATDLLAVGTIAVQGAVVITVSGSDNCGLTGAPAVTVTDAGGTSTTLTASGSGPWTYTYTVTATTANGIATITADVADEAGNTASDTATFTINKNQVTGTVSYSTLSNGSFSRTRNVVLVATDSAGTVLKSWTVAVVFANSAGTQIASGTYTLTDVPAGMAKLSAKTAWHLRKRQAVTADGNGQTIADFTLLGGDIKQDNIVNILDYSLLKSNWNTTNAAADINGDGVVQLLDYSLQKGSWFKRGDDQ
jgi:hypothetical protein